MKVERAGAAMIGIPLFVSVEDMAAAAADWLLIKTAKSLVLKEKSNCEWGGFDQFRGLQKNIKKFCEQQTFMGSEAE